MSHVFVKSQSKRIKDWLVRRTRSRYAVVADLSDVFGIDLGASDDLVRFDPATDQVPLASDSGVGADNGVLLLHRTAVKFGSSLLLIISLITGPFLAIVCTNMIFGGQNAGKTLSGVACYEVGLSGITLAVLFVLRSLGYRVLVAG